MLSCLYRSYITKNFLKKSQFYFVRVPVSLLRDSFVCQVISFDKMAKTPTMTSGKSKKSKVTVTDDAKPDKTSKVVDKKVEKKPVKKLDKVSKPKSSPDHPPFVDMVKEALENLKSRQGCSLLAIRNFISTQYNLEMNKRRQTLIKSYMLDEFQEGRLKMTNGDKSNGRIDFKKRFSVVATKKKSEK